MTGKPQDYRLLFDGNNDDCFRCALRLTAILNKEQLGPEFAFFQASHDLSHFGIGTSAAFIHAFLDNPEALRPVRKKELPHAKLTNDTCSRVYFPCEAQSIFSPALHNLGTLSKRYGMLGEPTL